MLPDSSKPVSDKTRTVQFDYKEYTSIDLSKMGLEEGHKIEKTDTAIWSIGYGDIKCGGSSIFSRLCGKKVLEPISKSKSGMYGFSENIKKEDIEFLVDLSPEGDEILSCALEGQKNYLVPIYFKNRSKPEIYTCWSYLFKNIIVVHSSEATL